MDIATVGFLLLGLSAGTVSGLIGIGGGVLITPTLVYLFGFSQYSAQGTTLALLVPLFGPACLAQGIHPIHLGVVLCLNLTIGMITPPLGACLIVVSAVTRENYWRLARASLPFILIEVAVLVLITLVPEITLYLPRILGYL